MPTSNSFAERFSRVPALMVALSCFSTGAQLTAADALPDHAIVAGFERFADTAAPADLARAGKLLLGELNCTSCHAADAKTAALLLKKQAPILDNVGSRVRPEFLREYLANPHGVKPGTTMPDVFAGVDPATKAQQVEALVHYLALTGGVTDANAVTQSVKREIGRAHV